MKIWNRTNKCIQNELVYGDQALRSVYENSALMKLVGGKFLSKKISKIMGLIQDRPGSARKIPDFVKKYGLPMEEFEPGPFGSFNEFFIRKFLPGKRTFDSAPERLPAFAEGRYFAFPEIKRDLFFPVKGEFLIAQALVGHPQWLECFEGGPLLICRLCPVDYHRFHFPDEGTVLDSYRLGAGLHSVNPLALEAKPDILSTNERWVSILDTKNFGRLAYIEIGALCVGKIIQTHPVGQPFVRGDEKGFFLFGGSTVVLMGEKGRWKPDLDLIEQTREGLETLVRLGEGIAMRG